jgi:hypothetical protein
MRLPNYHYLALYVRVYDADKAGWAGVVVTREYADKKKRWQQEQKKYKREV